MMEKLAQAGEGGGCTPYPCHYIYHHAQRCSVVTLQLRGQKHSLYFISNLYVLCGVTAQNLSKKLVYCFDTGKLTEAEEKDSAIPVPNEQNLPADQG
jgi:hypothetical protein